ncbi:hypothetical protein DAETH_06170 [Deinococcus aetherius]|uniref:Uncharacterized protein n=1 Tax=Deinococcus aetherius TaxID=200252 RepID=A0ABN6RBC0_9DEIO|nr:hypothetical protein [Deinococcus aetherius]BDP40648.1 hypothetical protein DAETH_06170 [Deinococcus aetherius]
MTVPFLLCVLMVVASGLHFGARAATLHPARRLPLTPVLAHAAVSLGAVWLGALLDPTPARLLWLFVVAASVAGFVAGVLRVRPVPEAEPTPASTS